MKESHSAVSLTRNGGILTRDPLNPMRLVREPSYDTE
jgi:hypothetical protein